MKGGKRHTQNEHIHNAFILIKEELLVEGKKS